MKRIFWLSSIFIYFALGEVLAQTLKTPFEVNNSICSRYDEVISFYQQLAKKSKLVRVLEAGPSDASFPIHAVVIASKKHFSPEQSRKAGKAVLFINNGIHPGEPDGVEAAMLFARDLVTDQNLTPLLEAVTLVIIPIYNVGGSLNRNRDSRVNQNGPEEYGYRGNAQNLDLNRDFAKCDSRNAKTFVQLFRKWNPDVFLETHTTDGADYPYVMTLLSSQRHKLQTELGNFMYKQFIPSWTKSMSEQHLEVIPYVNAEGDPMQGIYDFLDVPRFSTGYAALFHCMGFMAESHMLKPFPARVTAHKLLMHQLLKTMTIKKTELLNARSQALTASMAKTTMDVRWKLDKSRADSLIFSGYLQEKSISKVTGLEKLQYNTTKNYQTKVPYYNVCQPVTTVQIPMAYVLPAAYEAVVERLKLNHVRMEVLDRDTLLEATYYRILEYPTVAKPYENHYLHQSVTIEPVKLKRLYLKGDYLIPTDQPAVRYVVEMLEPEGHDSFFAWNFFDAVLQRKEYFSDYLFEPLAEALLLNNPPLQADFDRKKAEDARFAQNPQAMLEFIYDRSPYADPGYMIYPVGKVEKNNEE